MGGKKCCIFGCKTNYLSQEEEKQKLGKKLSVYRFPSNENEKKRWISVIPNNRLIVKKHTVVCGLHWPSDFEKVKVNGKFRPKHPPSIWPNQIPQSQIPTPLPPLRTTTKTSAAFRNTKEDELSSFIESDSIGNIEELKSTLCQQSRTFHVKFIPYIIDDIMHVQSALFQNGVPKFLVKIYDDLKFETYFQGKKITVASLSKNRVTSITLWSIFEEVIRYLDSFEPDHKLNILQEHLQCMSANKVGEPVYNHEVIVRAFEYFSTSRVLYNRLRYDYLLPSIQTLTRLTSKVSKMDELSFLGNIFKNISDQQKECIIIHDEVYVKKMMLYHGGSLFGKAVDDPNTLAKTVLGIMVRCLYGGPSFLSKMLPIARLHSQFLYDEIFYSVQNIQSVGGRVKVIICDGNRTNQSFFKKFKTIPDKPWLTNSGIFLLFDYVHLLKNVRNNWLTETNGELAYLDDFNIKRIAKWQHLKELYLLECDNLLKMSSLNEIAVTPKPIERQRVSTCLKVFCDNTYNALLNHPGMKKFSGVEDTAIFIGKVLKWWKILNVKSVGKDIRHRDPLEQVISDPFDERLNFILEFGKMCLQISGPAGKRCQQLTFDTAQSVFHTCNGLVELCRSLLTSTHKYVMMGTFSSDPLEKEFGKLRQGSGGTYFINVQKVIEKLNINKAKLLLTMNCEDIDLMSYENGHHCEKCGFLLDDKAAEVFDNLPDLELSVADEIVSVIVYIAGYIVRKDPNLYKCGNNTDTLFYFESFGKYTNSLNRGGLKIPVDSVCQWVIFSFILFEVVKDNVCRKSMNNLMMMIAEHYDFPVERKHGNILCNIFFKNYCLISTPRSGKEQALKAIKLTV